MSVQEIVTDRVFGRLLDELRPEQMNSHEAYVSAGETALATSLYKGAGMGPFAVVLAELADPADLNTGEDFYLFRERLAGELSDLQPTPFTWACFRADFEEAVGYLGGQVAWLADARLVALLQRVALEFAQRNGYRVRSWMRSPITKWMEYPDSEKAIRAVLNGAAVDSADVDYTNNPIERWLGTGG